LQARQAKAAPEVAGVMSAQIAREVRLANAAGKDHALCRRSMKWCPLKLPRAISAS